MKLIIDIPEEAKQVFDRAKINDLKCGYYDHGGIIGKAIQESIPFDSCEDCISRQAVLELVADYDLSMGQVVKGIHALPSVQPIRPKGKWIDDEFGSKCSCCGIHTHLDKFDRPMKFKYCSMCGADMRKEE